MPTSEYDSLVYTDGSADTTGVGAAASLVRSNHVVSSLRYHFKSPSQHTTFEPEAVGAILGAHVIAEENGIVTAARIGMDNTLVIKATKRPKPKPGH